MRIRDFSGKKVAIWGVGQEGRSVCRLLRNRLPELHITLLNDAPVSPELETEIGNDPALFLKIGDDAIKSLYSSDIVVKSPGISLYRPEISKAKQQGTCFTSATRLWFAEHPGEKTICITGTKGKSTTTALTAHLLKSAGLSIEMGGNIGVPITDLFDKTSAPDAWIFELSSYQTSDFDGFPEIAVLLNLFPEHLDWHGSLERYYQDKLNLVKNVAGEKTVLNHSDPILSALSIGTKGPVWFNHPDGFHAAGGHICRGKDRLYSSDKIRLPGPHNLSNVCAALTIAEMMGIDPISLIGAISEFSGLPHRLKQVGDKAGVRYVDDSISTTPQSAIAALNSFPNQRVTLLLGGFDRGLDMNGLARFLATTPCHAVITMPDSGPRIAEAIRAAEHAAGVPAMTLAEADDLKQAVEIAGKITPTGGVVLLSPAAPSYGRFGDYRERGNAFAKYSGFSK